MEPLVIHFSSGDVVLDPWLALLIFGLAGLVSGYIVARSLTWW